MQLSGPPQLQSSDRTFAASQQLVTGHVSRMPSCSLRAFSTFVTAACCFVVPIPAAAAAVQAQQPVIAQPQQVRANYS